MSEAAGAAHACPRCAAPLPLVPHHETVSCPSCGLSVPMAAVVELDGLAGWSDWARARSEWIRDRLVAGNLPVDWSAAGSAVPSAAAGSEQAPATGTRAVPPPPRQGTDGGTLLLVGGAVLLVLAGVFFVAFAWDLLGPTGQLTTLYLIGAAVLLAGLRLHQRLPGTATTLGVVGALLVAVSCAATRALGSDPMGPTAALALSLGAALALTWVGLRFRARMRAVGEVAALAGAGLTLGLLALAPADDAIGLAAPWAWWSAAVLLLGGTGLLVLHQRFDVVTWPLLASFSLFTGTVVAAVFAAVEAPVDDRVRPFVASLVLLLLAALSALLVRALPEHRPEPALVAAGSTILAALVSFVAGVADAGDRPSSSLALAAVAGFAWRGRGHLPASVQPLSAVAAPIVLGAAVGLAVAPWSAEMFWWQGLVAGLALASTLIVLTEVDRIGELMTRRRGRSGLLASATGLLVWLDVVSDTATAQTSSTSLAIVLALCVLAVAGWLEAIRACLPMWTVWASCVLLLAALIPLGDVADLTTTWLPEVYGALMAAVAGAAGFTHRQLRLPSRTPSLLVVGPAVALALAPTTVAVVQESLIRWSSGDGQVSTAYQVRVVMLFAVSALLVAIGAWRGWAGLVVPAVVALTAVSAVQLVDLGRFLPQWVSFALAGGFLVLAGARWESVRTLGRSGTRWLQHLH